MPTTALDESTFAVIVTTSDEAKIQIARRYWEGKVSPYGVAKFAAKVSTLAQDLGLKISELTEIVSSSASAAVGRCPGCGHGYTFQTREQFQRFRHSLNRV